MKHSESGEGIRPPACVVGFTGHRHLKNPNAVGQIIRTELETLRNVKPGKVTGYASVAIGADTLFVEACESLHIPWIATLPFSPADFQEDFTPNEWSHATQLLSRAIEVEICGSPEDRTAAYLRCGLRTVDESTLVMAVWDRQPPRGTGGTGDVVAYARKRNKPLILIHPDRLEVERESFQDGN